MRRTVIVLAALATLCAPAVARVIQVPDSAGTIQAGINLASNGDTVLVAPGTYAENIAWSGKSITLASHFLTTGDTVYIDSTVIDANHSGTVIICNSGVDTTALIYGFTVRNGSSSGIYCNGGSPRITYNVIEDNAASSDGAGVMMQGSSAPVIERNLIRHNQSGAWGGGIYIFDGSSPRVRWNVLYDNGVTKGGIFVRRDQARTIAGRVVEQGRDPRPFATNGGGILVTNYQGLVTKPLIHNNTIVDNVAASQGGGIFSNKAAPDIRNNIIVSNQGCGIYSIDSTLVCNYNDVWSNEADYGGGASAGTGAISTCPLFMDSVTHEYHLSSGSPCIDAGDPSLPLDPDSTRSDMGAFYSPQTGVAGHALVPELRQLSILPNPFVGSAMAAPSARFVVYDALGAIVEKTETARFGSGLSAGVYFVQAEGFSRIRVVKLARH